MDLVSFVLKYNKKQKKWVPKHRYVQPPQWADSLWKLYGICYSSQPPATDSERALVSISIRSLGKTVSKTAVLKLQKEPSPQDREYILMGYANDLTKLFTVGPDFDINVVIKPLINEETGVAHVIDTYKKMTVNFAPCLMPGADGIPSRKVIATEPIPIVFV